MPTRSSLLRGLSCCLAMLAAAPAGAQQPAPAGAQQPAPQRGIEEIVIQGGESDAAADFGAGDSVTGFGAEDLAALGAQDISDLASFTPNLEIVTAGATTPTFFIRGVGLNDFNPNSTGAVAIFQDDVAINAPALQLGTLFDVEAVNVLRGPQGTGLNRNASAGAIKIYTRKPTGEIGGFLRSDFGTYDFMDYEGAVESPIYEDLLAGRFAFRLTQRDGTMKNGCASAIPLADRVRAPEKTVLPPFSQCGEVVPQLGFSEVPAGLEKWVNDLNNWAARGTLLFQPTLDMSWFLNGHGARRDELSRLGQSIGTSGSYCPPEVNFNTCIRFPFTGRTNGLLGGSQAGTNKETNPTNGYMPEEIRKRYMELAPCVLVLNCGPATGPVSAAANTAKIKIANELAQDLDSDPWHGDFNLTGPTRNDSWGTFLNGEVALPGGMQFFSTSAYDSYDRLIDIDLDMSPQTLFQIKTKDDAWQFYQALKLEGQLDESAVRWEVGGWALREKLNATVDNDFGTLTVTSIAGVASREYAQSLWSAAGYASFAYDFLENFTIDGGVRFNWERKDLDMTIIGLSSTAPEGCTRAAAVSAPIECVLEDTWSAPTGTARLTYRFREDTQVYAKYTRGWKPGTYNATASQFTGPSIAEPEDLDSYETGLRGSWFDGRLGLDVSFFYYSYVNYQIFTARQFLGGTPEFVILNANDAEVYGSELDAVARPWLGSFFNVRFGWLESQFLDFEQVDQFLVAGTGTGVPVEFRERQASGNQLLNSPRFKVSMTAEQTIPLSRYGSLTFRYDGVWTDTTFYDSTEGRGLGDQNGNKFLPEDTIGQVPYWLHNLRLAWRAPSGQIELAAWVRNLTNKAYKTFAFDGSNFQSTTIYFVGDPRTVGGSIFVSF